MANNYSSSPFRATMGRTVATSTTSIDDLNIKCLCEILLSIDVAERLPLRTVSKKWCKAVDDCWRAVRTIHFFFDVCGSLTPPVDAIGGVPVHGLYEDIEIWTSDETVIEQVMKRCGDVATKLLNDNLRKNDCILPLATKYCRSLQDMCFSVSTEEEGDYLRQLLSLNKEPRSLDLVIACQDPKLCLNQIGADHLRTLELLGHPKHGLSSGLSQLIGRCSSSLTKLYIQNSAADPLESIGQRTSLEYLYLRFIYGCGVTAKSFYHLLQLKNLRTLKLPVASLEGGYGEYVPPITDGFLIALSDNLPLLESIRIEGPLKVTDEGFKSLAILDRLKELSISVAPGITDKFLILFSRLEELDLKQCSIGDAGTIKLLGAQSEMVWLGLNDTLVTNKTLVAAVNVMKKRKRGPKLTLMVDGTNTDTKIFTDIPESLTIVNRSQESEDEQCFIVMDLLLS